MNVLSLCDGLSCGHMALDKVGIKVDKYYAAEIKKAAIEATRVNFPNTIELGDVNKIRYENGVLYSEKGNFEETFDLVIFGSPCQSFSRAMKTFGRIGLEDKVRSGLFLECNRILHEVNPKYFLMENVIMKKDDEELITKLLGVGPIRINSKVVSGQLRDRLYWTNIKVDRLPENKNIRVQDILRDGYYPYDKARCLMLTDSHGFYNGCNYNRIKRFYRWYYKAFGTMVFPTKEDFERCVTEIKEIVGDNKPSASLFENYDSSTFDCVRYLWKEERAKLQTVPLKYVECLTEKDAADLLGDGWTVDVIAHIFSYI